ncbi:putative efflux pump membrane fusion protein [Novipirellula aureliae]|uniref:Putative efflux pump membrane fusion protein n=1 Tax=Novipirellula aureliae TaxID=2527966 RepID=A0A5C6E6X1_9BACT|nr:HlyD family efflux transporter periplasmic adaptor subunit [Novipirellula aureliae]TWU43401.1 putative efflux pump membrane fusion protein [Novipirellula aureliae]
MKRKITLLVSLVLLSLGCEKAPLKLAPKAAHPVTAMELRRTSPPTSFQVSGTVQSWKVEEIGFEVPGRIQWVLEPGRNVDGQITDVDQKLITQGTPLAKIDPARYEVAVESARAALDVAIMERQIVEIRLNDTLPADIGSAEADVRLAEDDFERIRTLQAQNAVSQAEYDQSSNRLQTQKLRLSGLRSQLKQTAAELKSADAKITVAEQNLQDAQRDLSHTVLYGSYRGQISKVHVVPGSVVSAGSPVLTLQMMDPIKVAIEVSAEQSRSIQRRRQVPVLVTMPNGSSEIQNAMVYMVDPSADPSTRTFTVTLLLLNKQFRSELPKGVDGISVARTVDIWPLNVNEIVGSENGIYLVEEDAIDSDEHGSFVWVLDGFELMQRMPDVMKVRKHYIQSSGLRIPFLGNWVFQPVTFLGDNDRITPRTLIAGELEYPCGQESNWDGESIVFDSGKHWMLRPGDLVDVNLGDDQSESGYYVPVEAIYEQSDETYLFVIEDGKAHKTRIEIKPTQKLDTESLLRVSPIGSDDFPAGTQIVVGGVHFLQDDDPVSVTDRVSEDAS